MCSELMCTTLDDVPPTPEQALEYPEKKRSVWKCGRGLHSDMQEGNRRPSLIFRVSRFPHGSLSCIAQRVTCQRNERRVFDDIYIPHGSNKRYQSYSCHMHDHMSAELEKYPFLWGIVKGVIFRTIALISMIIGLYNTYVTEQSTRSLLHASPGYLVYDFFATIKLLPSVKHSKLRYNLCSMCVVYLVLAYLLISIQVKSRDLYMERWPGTGGAMRHHKRLASGHGSQRLQDKAGAYRDNGDSLGDVSFLWDPDIALIYMCVHVENSHVIRNDSRVRDDTIPLWINECVQCNEHCSKLYQIRCFRSNDAQIYCLCFIWYKVNKHHYEDLLIYCIMYHCYSLSRVSCVSGEHHRYMPQVYRRSMWYTPHTKVIYYFDSHVYLTYECRLWYVHHNIMIYFSVVLAHLLLYIQVLYEIREVDGIRRRNMGRVQRWALHPLRGLSSITPRRTDLYRGPISGWLDSTYRRRFLFTEQHGTNEMKSQGHIRKPHRIHAINVCITDNERRNEVHRIHHLQRFDAYGGPRMDISPCIESNDNDYSCIFLLLDRSEQGLDYDLFTLYNSEVCIYWMNISRVVYREYVVQLEVASPYYISPCLHNTCHIHYIKTMVGNIEENSTRHVVDSEYRHISGPAITPWKSQIYVN